MKMQCFKRRAWKINWACAALTVVSMVISAICHSISMDAAAQAFLIFAVLGIVGGIASWAGFAFDFMEDIAKGRT